MTREAEPIAWQHYRCSGPHGMWLVREDPAAQGWLVALESDQNPWTVAAERPLCLFCGGDLEPVADLEALARLERQGALPR